MKTFQEKYNKVYKDVYTLMSNNFPPDMSDDFWKSYAIQADTLSKKYRDDPFIREMILAITNQLEREAKE